MKKYMERLLMAVVVIVGAFLWSQPSQAVDEPTIVNEAGYVYEIQFPDNQIEESGALKLKMVAAQKQKVPVKIRNLGNKELTVELSLNGARTNGAGGLEHGPNNFKEDKSMKYDLPDLVTVPQEVVVPASGESNFDVVIDMPDIAFDGIVTGGVQLQAKVADQPEDNATTIVNKIAYLFGITLQMTDTALAPELDLQKVYPGLENYRNAIFFDISNLQAMTLDGLTLDIEITKKGSQDVLYSSKKSKMKMAPNSLMSYPVSLSGEKMISGDYMAHVVATAQDKEWLWDKAFSITKEQADQFNQEDVNLVQERGLDWKLIAIIVGGGLAGILALSFVIRFAKKKNTSKKRKSKGKRQE